MTGQKAGALKGRRYTNALRLFELDFGGAGRLGRVRFIAIGLGVVGEFQAKIAGVGGVGESRFEVDEVNSWSRCGYLHRIQRLWLPLNDEVVTECILRMECQAYGRIIQ